MSETKHTPLQFIVVTDGAVVGEYSVTASPVPTPFQTPRQVTMVRESQRQYIENSVNARPKVEELVEAAKDAQAVIALFAHGRGLDSREASTQKRLEQAIREVEAALKGEA